MKKTLLFTIVSIALLASCKPAPTIAFKETLEVPSSGGRVTVDVSANYFWTASSSSDWVKVYVSGDTVLGLNVSENGDTTRTAVITLICQSVSRDLSVTQMQKDSIITDVDTLRLSSCEQEPVINVRGNIKYRCVIPESASSWLRQVSSKAMEDSKLTLHADANVGIGPRIAEVSLMNSEKGYSTKVIVVQSGVPTVLKVYHQAQSFEIPAFTGTYLSADVDWGDGCTQKYKTLAVHMYTSTGTHCVTVNAVNPEEFTISSVGDVTLIDVSGI